MPRFANPKSWASWIPMGLGEIKPHHIMDIVRAAGENWNQLPFAWRILRDGVCDGCALGTTGMKDFTLDGIHLCNVRLGLLRLNTMSALDLHHFEYHEELSRKDASALRELGRLAEPMIWRRGEPGYRRASWEEAYDVIAAKIRAVKPDELAFYLTSRGITSEVYYVAQKVARFLGTNNVDNSARLCHAPSTTGLKTTIGYAASTCSYKDWLGTDLIVFLGSNVPNNQPVTTKYLYYAKQQGTKVAVLNTYKEPGLKRYWVPSVFESALFGTKLADDFYMVNAGGDLAFLNGALKHLIALGAVDEAFVESYTTGFAQLKESLEGQSWESLEAYSGASREDMQRFAQSVAEARSAVFVWSMGITQHVHGVQNVQAIVNLALSRGFVGREKCGLMPIRGHSGVQGGAEVGCVPWSFPGGVGIDETSAQDFSERWGFEVPANKGLSTTQMLEAAHRGELELLYSVGGNFLETMPDPSRVREALERVPLRVHQDIVLSPQMFVPPKEVSLILPGQTRYEQRGGGTETTTERYVIFSPEIPGRRIGKSKPEWEILMEVAQAAYPERKDEIHFGDAQQIREDIAAAVPFYDGIQHFKKKGDAFQWGGPRLCADGVFNMPDKKGRFTALTPPEEELPEGHFLMATRRGKQFNSMVQREVDPLTGAGRYDVFMNEDDAQALGLEDGASVLLRSQAGQMQGRVRLAPIKRRNIQTHWPEGNVLLRHDQYEPHSHIPYYNAIVEVSPQGKPREE